MSGAIKIRLRGLRSEYKTIDAVRWIIAQGRDELNVAADLLSRHAPETAGAFGREPVGRMASPATDRAKHEVASHRMHGRYMGPSEPARSAATPREQHPRLASAPAHLACPTEDTPERIGPKAVLLAPVAGPGLRPAAVSQGCHICSSILGGWQLVQDAEPNRMGEP